MILRSVLTEMEKPFCEEDCPGPLPLPRRAHTDRAEIIRQRRREYGRFRWRKHPISLLTGSGTSPAVRSAEERKHRTGCSSCVARAAVYLLSRLPRGNWALFPRLLHKTICAIWRRTARATLIVLPPRYPSSPRHRKSLHREPASAPADDFWPSTHGQFVGQPQPSWLKSHGRRQAFPGRSCFCGK